MTRRKMYAGKSSSNHVLMNVSIPLKRQKSNPESKFNHEMNTEAKLTFDVEKNAFLVMATTLA